jgi:hypothetical protein
MEFQEGALLFEGAFGVCAQYDSETSGKTSLIHSLAGELGLDIYVVSLSAKGYVQTPTTSTHTDMICQV